METSFILLILVEVDVVKYMTSQQVCKRMKTLIREEYSKTLCDMQCRLNKN